MRLAPVALAAVALAGCRSYGSHDATDLMVSQYEVAVNQAVETAQQTQATMASLQGIAAQNPAIQSTLDEYSHVARTQDSLAKLHVLQLGRIKNPSAFKMLIDLGGFKYRRANEAYGALATEQAILGDQISTLSATLAGQPTTTTYVASIVDDSRFYFTPPFYHKLLAASEAGDLLARARAYHAPAAAPAPEAPAVPDSAAAVSTEPVLGQDTTTAPAAH